MTNIIDDNEEEQETTQILKNLLKEVKVTNVILRHMSDIDIGTQEID